MHVYLHHTVIMKVVWYLIVVLLSTNLTTKNLRNLLLKYWLMRTSLQTAGETNVILKLVLELTVLRYLT